MPLVSVVIPTRNRAALLPRALESVLAQTLDDFELIVVDDGSTDTTGDVHRRFPDPRIRWLARARAGVSTARNEGAARARGEWLAFLDDDDEWLPTFLERLVAAAASGADVVACLGTEVDTRGGRRPQPRPPDPDALVASTHGWYPLTGCTLVRRRAFLRAGGYPERLSHREDWYLWLAMVLAGRWQFVSEPLMLRYRHGGMRLSVDLAATRLAAAEMDRRYSREIRRRLGLRAATRWFWQNRGRDEFRCMLADVDRRGRRAAGESLVTLAAALPRSASSMWRPLLVLLLGPSGYFRLHQLRPGDGAGRPGRPGHPRAATVPVAGRAPEDPE